MPDNQEARSRRLENDDAAATEDVEAHVKHKGATDEGSDEVEAHVKNKGMSGEDDGDDVQAHVKYAR
jgi:hypothetical protein